MESEELPLEKLLGKYEEGTQAEARTALEAHPVPGPDAGAASGDHLVDLSTGAHHEPDGRVHVQGHGDRAKPVGLRRRSPAHP